MDTYPHPLTLASWQRSGATQMTAQCFSTATGVVHISPSLPLSPFSLSLCPPPNIFQAHPPSVSHLVSLYPLHKTLPRIEPSTNLKINSASPSKLNCHVNCTVAMAITINPVIIQRTEGGACNSTHLHSSARPLK